MADTNTSGSTVSKIDAAAEKAYAEAAAKKIDAKKVEKAVEADAKPEPKVEAVAKAVDAPAKKAPAAKRKPAAKKAPAKKVAAKKAAPKKAAKKSAPRKVVAKKAAPKTTKTAAAAKTASPVTKAKETIMATAKKAQNTDFVDTAKTVAADAQTRLKSVYAKGTEVAGDVVTFHKHNLEAMVESGKVLTSGMQDMGREALSDTKKAAEQVTEDVRLMAAVKSPTEFVKLQGDIARRNVDAAIAYSSKSTEAWLKLANEAMAPLTSRASEAVETIKKAA